MTGWIVNQISERDVVSVAASPNRPTQLGDPVRRGEDPALLRGDSTFVANIELPGALVAYYVTSIEAHASITVDVEAARREPGVVLALAGVDLPEALNQQPGVPPGIHRNVLAVDRVQFVGEPVAVVVASSLAEAMDAAESIVVDYQPREAVIDPADAATRDEYRFLEATGPGDAAESPDFSDCEVVVEEEFIVQRLAPCPLETRVAASYWTEDGQLVHHAAAQGVHPIRNGLADQYGLDHSQVRVISQDVGGSFGAKARLYPEEILLPELARRLGVPVRWTPTRSADMTGLGHSRAQKQRVRLGGSQDGVLKAIDVEILADLGAYATTAGGLARNTGMILPGPYTTIDQVHWQITAVRTNTTPLAAYRGAGRPEAGSLLDRAVNLFAAEIGMDQVEIRRKNLASVAEMGYVNPTGLKYDSGDYHQALDLLVEELGYDTIRADQRQAHERGDSVLPGVGISTFIDRTAGVPNPEYGSVELQADGSFLVLTGSSPYGQGHHTTWATLVSARTGVPQDQIRVIHGDSAVVPRGGITGGSRSAQRAGSAIVEATDAVVDQAKARAAALLEASVDDVILDTDRGAFHVVGAPGAAMVSWADVYDDEDELRCESDYIGEGATVPYGAYGAVVSVDTETGAVTVDRLVTVDDAGVVINPLIVFGQVHGAVAQGIGQALFEEFRYDDHGNPLTGNFMDYAFASAADLPSFECHLTQNPSPQNHLGAKGIGESGTIGAVPAVQNAVVDALAHLGVRHIDTPLTPENVWKVLSEVRFARG